MSDNPEGDWNFFVGFAFVLAGDGTVPLSLVGSMTRRIARSMSGNNLTILDLRFLGNPLSSSTVTLIDLAFSITCAQVTMIIGAMKNPDPLWLDISPRIKGASALTFCPTEVI